MTAGGSYTNSYSKIKIKLVTHLYTLVVQQLCNLFRTLNANHLRFKQLIALQHSGSVQGFLPFLGGMQHLHIFSFKQLSPFHSVCPLVPSLWGLAGCKGLFLIWIAWKSWFGLRGYFSLSEILQYYVSFIFSSYTRLLLKKIKIKTNKNNPISSLEMRSGEETYKIGVF